MNYVDVMSQSFQNELEKIASEKRAQGLGEALGKYKFPATVIGGIAAWETAKKINRDRKMGRQLRVQSRGRY